MKEIIDDIKQNITPSKIFWAYPIALKLDEYGYSLAIQWAIECIKIYGYEFNPDKLSQMSKYIQQIDERDTLTASQCVEISREIWYLPEREDVQTAVAQLWGSISFKYGDEEGEYRARDIASVVELLLPDVFNRSLLDKYLNTAQRIYEEYSPRI